MTRGFEFPPFFGQKVVFGKNLSNKEGHFLYFLKRTGTFNFYPAFFKRQFCFGIPYWAMLHAVADS